MYPNLLEDKTIANFWKTGSRELASRDTLRGQNSLQKRGYATYVIFLTY